MSSLSKQKTIHRWWIRPLTQMLTVLVLLLPVSLFISNQIQAGLAKQDLLLQKKRANRKFNSIHTATLNISPQESEIGIRQSHQYFSSQVRHLSKIIARHKISEIDSVRIAADIIQISQVVEIDPFLIAAIAYVESQFKPRRTPQNGAFGLMQLLPSTALALSKQIDYSKQPNPKSLQQKNILIGATYLKQLQGYFGSDLQLILAAYNFGPTSIERADRKLSRLPRHVQDYVSKVMTLYTTFNRPKL